MANTGIDASLFEEEDNVFTIEQMFNDDSVNTFDDNIALEDMLALNLDANEISIVFEDHPDIKHITEGEEITDRTIYEEDMSISTESSDSYRVLEEIYISNIVKRNEIRDIYKSVNESYLDKEAYASILTEAKQTNVFMRMIKAVHRAIKALISSISAKLRELTILLTRGKLASYEKFKKDNASAIKKSWGTLGPNTMITTRDYSKSPNTAKYIKSSIAATKAITKASNSVSRETFDAATKASNAVMAKVSSMKKDRNVLQVLGNFLKRTFMDSVEAKIKYSLSKNLHTIMKTGPFSEIGKKYFKQFESKLAAAASRKEVLQIVGAYKQVMVLDPLYGNHRTLANVLLTGAKTAKDEALKSKKRTITGALGKYANYENAISVSKTDIVAVSQALKEANKSMMSIAKVYRAGTSKLNAKLASASNKAKGAADKLFKKKEFQFYAKTLRTTLGITDLMVALPREQIKLNTHITGAIMNKMASYHKAAVALVKKSDKKDK